MSLLLNSVAATFIPTPIQNEQESFHMFYQTWIAEQDRHLHELLSASQVEMPASREDEERLLRPLIDVVLEHYEEYFRAKTKCSKEDVLPMFSPTWNSSFENAFLWIGGWRPTMAFHLLYSKSGLQMEAKLAEILSGLDTNDLGDLSPSQFSQVDELHRNTVKEEKHLNEKMAKHQETVADNSMVELSQVVTELQSGEVDVDRVESTLAPKEEGLLKVLGEADDLRLRTLKGVTRILKPIQTVHFLIAAAELHLRVHEWGLKKDDARCNAAHLSNHV